MQDDPANLVTVVAPGDASLDLGRLASPCMGAPRPFAQERIDILNELSQKILQSPELRRNSAAVGLAYWLRKASISGIVAGEQHRFSATRTAVPTGLVFHVTPSNVDTMFVFSWALAFLCGNRNIVRLTRTYSAMARGLLDCISDTLRPHGSLASENVFVTYEHNDEVSARISLCCDHRIVWGGDETVRLFRAIPLSPHASERAFSSKQSAGVIDAARFIALTQEERNDVVGRIAGDLAPFDQMACSSPNCIFWIGDETACRRALDLFAEGIEHEFARRNNQAPDVARAVHRTNHAFAQAAAGNARSMIHLPFTTHLLLAAPRFTTLPEPVGGGLLCHLAIASLSEVPPLLNKKTQTLVYFGITEEQLETLAKQAGPLGVDRLVPPGKALEFSPYWDGYDLIGDFLKVISIAHQATTSPCTSYS